MRTRSARAAKKRALYILADSRVGTWNVKIDIRMSRKPTGYHSRLRNSALRKGKRDCNNDDAKGHWEGEEQARAISRNMPSIRCGMIGHRPQLLYHVAFSSDASTAGRTHVVTASIHMREDPESASAVLHRSPLTYDG
jgi:hypothetical protein